MTVLREVTLFLLILGAMLGAVWLAITAIQQKQKVTRFEAGLQQVHIRLHSKFDDSNWRGHDLASLHTHKIFPADMQRDGKVVTPWGSQLVKVDAGVTYITLHYEWSGIERECWGIDLVMRHMGLTGLVDSTDAAGKAYGGPIGITADPADIEQRCRDAATLGSKRHFEIDIER